MYSHPSNIYILIKVLNPGGVAVFWRRPLVYRLCLPSWVGGDMRMRGSAFVDIVCLALAVKIQKSHVHKSNTSRKLLHTIIYSMCLLHNVNMFYLYKPFGKRTCNGETEHAASEDTKDRTCPANKESSAQFIPTDKEWMQQCFLITGATFKCFKYYKITGCLLLCNKHRVKELWCYPMSIQGAGRQWAEAWEQQKKADLDQHKILLENQWFNKFTILTTKNENNPSKTCNPGFVLVSSTDFGAFHSNKGKYGTEKTQADRGDHQTPASLDVTCKHKTEVNLSSWGSTVKITRCAVPPFCASGFPFESAHHKVNELLTFWPIYTLSKKYNLSRVPIIVFKHLDWCLPWYEMSHSDVILGQILPCRLTPETSQPW